MNSPVDDEPEVKVRRQVRALAAALRADLGVLPDLACNEAVITTGVNE